MKICFVSRIFPPEIGGASSVTYNVSKEMAKKGHKIFVVTLQGEEKKKFEKVEGVEIYRIYAPKFNQKNLNIFTWGVAAAATALTIIKINFQYKLDVIHAMDIVIGTSAITLSKPFLNGVKCVTRYGGDLPYELACRIKPKGFEVNKGVSESWKNKSLYIQTALLLQKFLLKRFDLLLPTTKHGKSLLLEMGINPKKIILTPCGVDIKKFKPRGDVIK